MQTARDDPGNYGTRFRDVRMVFEVVEQEEGEDYYTVAITFRPEGDFRGTPGREQFFIEKEGRVAYRQVLSFPQGGGRRFPILPVAIGLVAVVAVVGVVGVVFASGGDGGGATSVAALAPTATIAPTPPPAVVPPPVNTPTPQPTQTLVPRVTAVPIPTRTPVAPTPRPVTTRTATRTPTSAVVAPSIDRIDVENMRYAMRGLPSSFLEIDAAELGVSITSLGPPFTELVGYASTEPLEFVFSAAGLMTNLERIQLENELADPDGYLEDFAVGFRGSGGADLAILDLGFLDIASVGGRSIGVYVVFESQGVVLRQDVVQFTRGNFAGLVYNLYVPGEVPTTPAEKAAFFLDDELRRFPVTLVAAPARAPTPSPTRPPPHSGARRRHGVLDRVSDIGTGRTADHRRMVGSAWELW